MSLSRRPRRKRFAEVIVMAAVALATLALAGPAVARPAHSAGHLAPASTTAAIVLVALALVVAAALVIGVALMSTERHRRTAIGQIRKEQASPRHRLAA